MKLGKILLVIGIGWTILNTGNAYLAYSACLSDWYVPLISMAISVPIMIFGYKRYSRDKKQCFTDKFGKRVLKSEYDVLSRNHKLYIQNNGLESYINAAKRKGEQR